MRKYVSSILLASTILIAELHTFWEKKQVVVENWILAAYKPMPIQWNVKFASLQLIYIVWFLAWVLYVPNRTNRWMVLVFFGWSILDGLMYFYNYKTGKYGLVYFGLVLIGVIAFNRKSIKTYLFG